MLQEQRVGFGNYAPDLPAIANPGLTIARDALPIAGGWQGRNAIKVLTGFTSLPARPRGAIAGIDSAGNPFNVAGTELTLQMLLHRSAGVLNGASGESVSLRQLAALIVRQHPEPIEIRESAQRQAVTHRRFDVTARRRAFPELRFTPLSHAIARPMQAD